MSFSRAARAALAGKTCLRRMTAAAVVCIILVLAMLSLSCGGSYSRSAPNHSAYVTLPATGNVLLLHIDGANGNITVGAQTPQTLGTTPTGLALLPSKKFLYAINSSGDSISIFSVASDGTLALIGTPVPAGNGPHSAAIDPSGKYLLVTNVYGSDGSGGDVSVYSIDGGSGALTEVGGSPFPANTNPTEILVTPDGSHVYVTNPGIGMVTAFSLSNGVLSQLPTSPVVSGAGATGLAMDATGRFLYVANPSATNGYPYTNTQGNISGFNIDPNSGALTPMLGSPFTATSGSGPTALAIDPGGKYVYATTPGSADSIWCFTIDPTAGQLTSVSGSPFSLAAGGLFAVFDPTVGYFYIGSSSGTAIEGYTYNSSTGVLTAVPGSPFSTKAAPGKMVFSE
jgi:6-phosphogluconolactonase (cycloisomerase 2 family)